MKKIGKIMLAVVMSSLVLVGCGSSANKDSDANQTANTTPKAQTEILVSAAASLKDAMTDIEKDYTSKHSDIKLTFTFDASGTLQKQIEQGAPADIFFSAGAKQMDTLEKENLLASGTRKDVLLNDLVLVVGKDNTTITSINDVAKASKVAIGIPASVPAGQYAQQTLTKLGLWDSLNSANKIVQAQNVTAVLTDVESGNAEAGFVYKSDAQGSDKVKVVATAADDSHDKIVYPAAVLSNSRNMDAAKTFNDYLSSSDAQKIFEKYGFKSAQ